MITVIFGNWLSIDIILKTQYNRMQINMCDVFLEMTFTVTSAYKFVPLKDLEEWKQIFLDFCNQNAIKGTILLAAEGININLTAGRDSLDAFYQFIDSFTEFKELEYKENNVSEIPFGKMKVRLKDEIIKFQVADLDTSNVGEYLESNQWDELISSKKTILIDTRNDYEVAFGSFKNAINPNTRHFSELPKWVKENMKSVDKETPVAMFCTGGVRCEKSTAYMKKIGFKNVYHLRGGIIKYLEDTKGRENLWQGECFVFDDRIVVNSKLESSIAEIGEK